MVKNIKNMLFILTLIFCISFIFSIGNLYATWYYAKGSVLEVSKLLNLLIFPWEGSELLPEDDELGANHKTLIDTIINGEGIGLNTSSSYLNSQIKKRQNGSILTPSRDTLGSMAVSQGDELNTLFSLQSHNLDFLIKFVSSTEYHIYTTAVDLGTKGTLYGNNGSPTTPIGEYISPIYRTVVIKTDGFWAATETALGKAKSAWYEESRLNSSATQIPSFDPDTWVKEN